MNIRDFFDKGAPGDECIVAESALTYSFGVKVPPGIEVLLRAAPPAGYTEKPAKLFHSGKFLTIQSHSDHQWVGELITAESFQ